MKYYEVEFIIKPYKEDFADVVSALIADIGFETFEPTETGVKAYIQQSLWEKDALDQIVVNFPCPDVSIEYSLHEAPDEDWNQTWEEEGFKPILIDGLICIHDVHHTDTPKVKYDIKIHPKQAFGTGSHQTTRMILRQMAEMELSGKRIVDAGTGTGILSIMAHQMGACDITAYDIDEWSVENTRANCELNGITNNIRILLGDSSVIASMKEVDLLIANINRNILLQDMPVFCNVLRKGGQLLISGFYVHDIPVLEAYATTMHANIKAMQKDEEWAMLLLETNAASRMDS